MNNVEPFVNLALRNLLKPKFCSIVDHIEKFVFQIFSLRNVGFLFKKKKKETWGLKTLDDEYVNYVLMFQNPIQYYFNVYEV